MPAIKLFPLVFKNAGFLRDGSLYQGDFCTDGQWVRFYQSKPKKIGGQLAIQKFEDPDHPASYKVPQGCTHITSVWIGGNIIYIAANPSGIYTNISKVSEPNVFANVWVKQEVFDPAANADMLWQSATVITANTNEQGNPQGPAQTHVVLFGCNNLNNINNVTPAKFYDVTLEGENIKSIKPFEIYPPNAQEALLQQDLQNLNGGIVFVNNFLFIYGTKGTVVWSRRENPFSFTGGASGRINISNDKVIYGAGVRGGNNPPTILFWTMNSVVRVSNQTNTSEIKAPPEFQVDIITKESSILSSRSVVEYDGMFFWLGVDRIFLYNGVVREVVNNTNFDWFFANLDILRRQLVFGIKNSEKGEIWWYFPVMGVEGGCSAALIYNIRENIWYDTRIARDCGFFDGSSGKMITYGKNLAPIIGDSSSYIWVHEEGYEQVSDDGLTKKGIESSYTTPIISLTAFSPFGEGGGQNNEIWVDRLEPDFKLDTGKVMNMTINSKDYADQAYIDIFDGKIVGGKGKVDIRAQGRNISFTFTTKEDFTHGYPLVGIKVGDGRG